MTSFEWFIARRYLFSRERGALVSLISVISVAGVALGVAALIVVIGVMDGADDLLFGRIAQLYPHVRIIDRESGAPVDEALLARLRGDARVEAAEPVYERKTLIPSNRGGAQQERPELVKLIGTDSIGKGTLFPMPEVLSRTVAIPDRTILLGLPLMARLRVGVYEQLRVVASNPISTAVGPQFKTIPMTNGGWFNTRIHQFDSNAAFVNRRQFEELYRLRPGSADYIHVKLRNPYAADAFKSELDLGKRYRVTTWSEENGEFFGALKLEKMGMGLTLLLTVLVAAFNIIGTLILTVIEKTREVGLLRAVGASETSIARIFVMDGMMIGAVGTAIGGLLGVGLCLWIRYMKFDLPEEVYAFDTLPISIRAGTIALIIGASMLICIVAAIFPARQAARLHPVEALRYE